MALRSQNGKYAPNSARDGAPRAAQPASGEDARTAQAVAKLGHVRCFIAYRDWNKYWNPARTNTLYALPVQQAYRLLDTSISFWRRAEGMGPAARHDCPSLTHTIIARFAPMPAR
jgi:hypothetical protein